MTSTEYEIKREKERGRGGREIENSIELSALGTFEIVLCSKPITEECY